MTNSHFIDFDLDNKLLKALTQKGFTHPTLIQTQTLTPILEGRNIIASSPTGTGKTIAFLLPIIQYLLDFPRRKSGPARVLILTPTRELAIQIAAQARALSEFTSLKVTTITGGTAYINHMEALEETQDIVIATPGRLLQYTQEKAFNYHNIEIVTLDEADRMLDMGFFKDIDKILAQAINRKQTLLFSATIEGDLLHQFIRHSLVDPIVINAEPSRKEHKKIVQYYYHADSLQHKNDILIELLKMHATEKGIVFVRKKERLHELVNLLKLNQLSFTYLEGDMVQIKRTQAIQAITEGKRSILLATDIAARGLDIQDINYVINFDLPRTADVYLHRIGRTGRNGKKGVGYSLVEAHDYTLLEKIRRYLKETIRQRVFDALRPVTQAPLLTTKKKKNKTSLKKSTKTVKPVVKVKKRARVEKNRGKRRIPSNNSATIIHDSSTVQ